MISDETRCNYYPPIFSHCWTWMLSMGDWECNPIYGRTTLSDLLTSIHLWLEWVQCEWSVSYQCRSTWAIDWAYEWTINDQGGSSMSWTIFQLATQDNHQYSTCHVPWPCPKHIDIWCETLGAHRVITYDIGPVELNTWATRYPLRTSPTSTPYDRCNRPMLSIRILAWILRRHSHVPGLVGNHSVNMSTSDGSSSSVWMVDVCVRTHSHGYDTHLSHVRITVNDANCETIVVERRCDTRTWCMS